MICKHCGNEIDGKLPFCPYCGNKTEQPAPEEPKPAQPETQPSEEPERQAEQQPLCDEPQSPQDPQPDPQAGGAPQNAQQNTQQYTQQNTQQTPTAVPLNPGQVYYIPGQPGQQGQAAGQQVFVYTDRFGGFPMKWHKFLIYFGIWAFAILSFAESIRYLTGSAYGVWRMEVYEAYPVLHPINIVYGLILLAVAGFGIFTAISMLNYKKNAPLFLIIVLTVGAAADFAYGLFEVLFIGVQADASLISVNVWTGGTGSFVTSLTSALISGGISALIICLTCVYYKKRRQFFTN